MHPTSAHFSNQPVTTTVEKSEPEGTDAQLMEPTNPHPSASRTQEDDK